MQLNNNREIGNEILSIIVLSYRNGSFLEETIDSILLQDYPAIEMVICDDASPEFDQEAYRLYIDRKKGRNIVDVKFIINECNQGTVKNLNNGIKYSTGTYVKVIAGDDCISSDDVFSRQVEYLKRNPKSYLVVGNIVQCNEKMIPIQETGFMSKENYGQLFNDNEALIKYICRTNQNALSTQAICFRKSFFEQYGLYDERFSLIEDLPMAVHIVKNRVSFGYINYPCVKHRGSVGVSTSYKAFDKRRIKYYEDLEKYFRISLMPIKRKVGPFHIVMRHKVAEFRVNYCNLDSPSVMEKVKLGVKYLVPLTYYFLNNSKKALLFIKSR